MRKKLRDSFVPHEGNQYAPHALQQAALLGMLGLVLLSFLAANFQAILWQSSDWLVGAVLPAVVVTMTNDERDDLDLPPLTRNAVLDAAAQLKADDMAKNGYFAHYSPAGVSPWHWFYEANYQFAHAGENLAVHFSDSGEVVEAWMDSPTHRANIVNQNYQEIGVGTAKGTYEGYDTVFVVQLFGTPIADVGAVSRASGTDLAPVAVAPETAPVLAVADVTEPAPTEVVAGVSSDAVESVVATTSEEAGTSSLAMAVETTPAVAPDIEVVPEAVTIAETVVDETTISLYSDLMATSSGLAARTAPELGIMSAGTTAPIIAQVATQPNRVLQVLYLILGALVAFALFMSVLIEWRKQQLVQVSYGVMLLFLMSGLFYVHSIVTSGALIL
jgi:hypothetical protein